MKHTIEQTEKNGEGKIILSLEIYDYKFEVVKLYDEQSYEEALAEAEEELQTMIQEGLPKEINRKVNYLMNDKTRKENQGVRQKDQ